ncbi:MAG: ABC transporter permease [Bacteroidaceae bacterium]|nr:ABC transporter permease [Bacteroidaceae bacterium]
MKSYLKFLSRNRVYTFISIVGLALSLMFVILLGDYVWRQFSIDSQHPDADRIYMVGNSNGFFMWPQVAQEIEALCPDVEQTCRVFSQSGKIRCGERELDEQMSSIIMLTDPTFFDFFAFRLKVGNPETVLDSPDKCVITESLARKLFADRNPIGESLQLVGSRNVKMGAPDPYDSTLVYNIAGIIEDLDRTVFPNETQILVSMERYPQVMGYKLNDNAMAYGPTGVCKILLKLKDGAQTESTRSLIQQHVVKKRLLWQRVNLGDVTLTPLREVLFAPQNDGLGLTKGDRGRLYILLSAVLAIFLFAVSNYVNLTVANTGFRAKEMAARRLLGSTGIHISLRLIAESVLMVALSFVVGLALSFVFEQDAARLFRGKIALASDINAGSVCLCLGFILLTGFVSGVLPSWHLSRYQPIDIVKGSFRFRSKMLLSRVFIFLQNVIIVVMLTAALTIWLQLSHIIHAPMGFNTENLYLITYPSGIESQAVRSRLEQMPFVERIGCYRGTTFIDNNNSMISVNREDKSVFLYQTWLDSTALELYGLNILTDNGPASDGWYLNEEALRQLDMKESDREIVFSSERKSPLNGVVADFHKTNILADVQPFAIQIAENLNEPDFLVKTNGSREARAAFAQMLLDLGCPAAYTEYHISGLQEKIRESFEDRQNTLRIVSLFTLLAIVISVMGFVGMSLFFIRQRKSEIGIRKILGSSSSEVMWLMLRIFCMPLLVSFLFAIPLSYHIMSQWLQDFSYRIALSPWIFAATCLFSLLTAVLSVGIQIWRAAYSNPIESLRNE